MKETTVLEVKVLNTLVIKDSSIEDILSKFDGNVSVNGVKITNIKGNELVNQCADCQIVSVVDITNDDEETVYDTEPVIVQFLSTNQTFTHNDTILIEGNEYIVVRGYPDGEVMLHNFDNATWLGWGCETVEELNEQLKLEYPTFQVIRRVRQ